MPVTYPSLHDREWDILDQKWAGRITRDEAAKLLEELHRDYLEAVMVLRMADEADNADAH